MFMFTLAQVESIAMNLDIGRNPPPPCARPRSGDVFCYGVMAVWDSNISLYLLLSNPPCSRSFSLQLLVALDLKLLFSHLFCSHLAYRLFFLIHSLSLLQRPAKPLSR